MYLDPCTLCMVQRIAVALVGICCLAALLHNPKRRGKITYSIIQLLFCVAGAAAAGRHVWLQNAPADKIPECFPGITPIFAHNPLIDALVIVFSGTGECAEVSWEFLNLSIPAWMLIAFGLFGITAIMQMVRTR